MCPFWAQRIVEVAFGSGHAIIARKTLRDFVESLRGNKDQKAVKSARDAGFQEARNAHLETPAAVTRNYANASIVGDDRVVFNIKGNAYRLVVAIDYRRQIVFIKWLGTHANYDKINVKRVRYED